MGRAVTTPAPQDDPRIARRAALLVLAAALTAALVTVAWNAQTQPVFAHRPHPMLAQALLHQHPPAISDLDNHALDLAPTFVAATASMNLFGRTYVALLGGQSLGLGIFVALCALVAWRLAGPRAGAMAAWTAAATPVSYVAALGFDEHLFNMTLVAGAAWCVAHAFQTRRPWALLPVGAAIGLALRFAFVPSNGVLAASVMVALTAGRWWETRKEPWDAKTWVSALIAALALAVLLSRRDGSWDYVAPGYLGREMTNAAGGFARNLAAYPYLTARYLWGPLMTLGAIASLILACRARLNGRFLLLAWLVVPFAALTAIPKKNPYYIFYALAVAAPAVGIALAHWADRPRRRFATSTALAAALAWCWVPMFTAPDRAPPVGGFEDTIHEAASYRLHRPIPDAPPDAASAKAIAALPVGEAHPFLTVLATDFMLDELRYFLLLENPDFGVFVVVPATRPPESPTHWFLALKQEGSPTPAFEESVRASLAAVDAQIAAGAADNGRRAYLQTLLDAPSSSVAFEDDRYVVFAVPSPPGDA
jgi:hypothetical protein